MTTPLLSNVTLPEPVSFVMDVMLPKLPATLTLYGSASVPLPSTVVLVPAANLVLATDTL